MVDNGHTYFTLDTTGDGVPDGITQTDLNTLLAGRLEQGQTDVYHFGGKTYKLASVGNVNDPLGGDHFGTSVGSSIAASPGSNANNAKFDGLLSVWDAYNGTGTGQQAMQVLDSGGAAYWPAGDFWAADIANPTTGAHYYMTSAGVVIAATDPATDTVARYAVFEQVVI